MKSTAPISAGSNDRPADTAGATRQHVPVTVILEKRLVSRSRWSVPSWYLHTVGVGRHLRANEQVEANEQPATQGEASRAEAPGIEQGIPAGVSDKGELFAWKNLRITLYKDACERYWHALIGDRPLIYVICREDDMLPIAVSVDYDEANAAAETDQPVLSAPIPPELYRLMERFVLDHYQPKEFKKRKRRQWAPE